MKGDRVGICVWVMGEGGLVMGIYEGLGPRLKGVRGLLSMSVLYTYYIT